MTSLVELCDNHPEGASHPILSENKMVLNCGATAPIMGFFDNEGERIQLSDLDLFDEFRVAYGPTPSGKVMVCHAGPRRRYDA